MPITFSPAIQPDIDYILDYMSKFKAPPMEEYKDREILLTLAALNIEDMSEQWSMLMDSMRPFCMSKTQPYYTSNEYLAKQLAILKDIHNLEDVISAIYDAPGNEVPRVTVEQTNAIWFSGFLQHNEFMMPKTCTEASSQAIINFISFIDSHYDFIKTFCIDHPDSLRAIETFEIEILYSTYTYTTNSELFAKTCAKLTPDIYSVKQNATIVMNVYLHALATKQDPVILLNLLFEHSPIMQEVSKTIRTMLDMGLEPFDYHDTSLLVKAFESLQAIDPEPLPDCVI